MHFTIPPLAYRNYNLTANEIYSIIQFLLFRSPKQLCLQPTILILWCTSINSIFVNINQLLSSHKDLSTIVIFPTFPTAQFFSKKKYQGFIISSIYQLTNLQFISSTNEIKCFYWRSSLLNKADQCILCDPL
jgi:hypothetical protein